MLSIMMESCLKKVENIVGEAKNNAYKHFLLLQQCFAITFVIKVHDMFCKLLNISWITDF